MITVLLVRHATCAQMDSVLLGRALDPPLDAHGERQAVELAHALAGLPVVAVEASPARRTQETAAVIAAHFGCGWRVASDLDEVDFGDWAGRPFADLATDPRWIAWNGSRATAPTPAGENMPRLQRRIMRRLRNLRAIYPSGTLALVTHAELIRAAVLYCRRIPLDSYASVEVAPASVTTVRVSTSGAQVLDVNRCLAS